MYSKYLDYTEAAIRANHLAQAENDQKELIINQLKNEVFDLKRIDLDFQKLNALIFQLGEKYELLTQEKDRGEKEQRQSLAYLESKMILIKIQSLTSERRLML